MWREPAVSKALVGEELGGMVMSMGSRIPPGPHHLPASVFLSVKWGLTLAPRVVNEQCTGPSN